MESTITSTAPARDRRRTDGIAATAVVLLLAAGLAGPPALAGPAPDLDLPGTPATPTAAAPAFDPSDPVQWYVRAVYRDLLERDPDPGGLAAWTDALHRGAPRAAVASAITESAEFRGRLVDDAYDRYLFRAADDADRRYWTDRLAHGMTQAQLVASLVASDEWWNRSHRSAFEWIGYLYWLVLGRHPGDGETGYWITRFAVAGTSRGTIAMGIAASTEHLSSVVDGYYQRLLRRSIEPEGGAYWVRVLQSGGREETIAAGILASDEYWTRAVIGTRLAALHLEPATVTLSYGGSQAYTVSAVDERGEVWGDVSDLVTMDVDGDTARCAGTVCSPRATDTSTVRASLAGLTVTRPVDMLAQGPSRGTLAVWGGNASGILGTGGTARVETLTVPQPDVTSWADITAGARSAMGVRTDGTLWIWGVVNDLDFPEPIGLPRQVGSDRTWAAVADGRYAVRSDGEVFTISHELDRSGGLPSRRGVLVVNATDFGPTSTIAGSGLLTAQIDGSGALRAAGALCDPCTSGDPRSYRWYATMSGGTWTHVSAAGTTALAVRADGTLWGFGSNDTAQLDPALGSTVLDASPIGPADARWTWAETNGTTSFGVRTDGTLWAWGSSTHGLLGTGDLGPRPAMVQVGAATTWRSVEAGAALVAAVRVDGTLWVWGDRAPGGALAPVQVPGTYLSAVATDAGLLALASTP